MDMNTFRIAKSSFFRLLGISSALCFLLTAWLVYRDAFVRMDYVTMVSLQAIITRSADMPLSLLTLLGSSEMTFLFLGVLVLILWRKRASIPWSVGLILCIFLIEIIGKIGIVHLRPPAEMNRYTLPFSFPSSGYAPSLYSFPSGHMARSAFMVVLLLFLVSRSSYSTIKKNLFSGGVLFYGGIIFVSRMSLGAHWLSDVIGGCFLGIAVASFTLSYWPDDVES